jgi:hypothetical protein
VGTTVLEVAPSDLVRLPVPVPANGHTDATIRAVRRALNAIEGEELNGLVLPVAVLREQVARMWLIRWGIHRSEAPDGVSGPASGPRAR